MPNTFQEWIDYSKYGGLDFNRLRSGHFEGPAIVIPPALPEDTYFPTGGGSVFRNGHATRSFGKLWKT